MILIKKDQLSKEARQMQDNDEDQPSSSSLIARAGQIMAIIISLGMIGMIASMLVSESLSGDAGQINRAGALRMHAIKVSRAILVEQHNPSDSGNVRKEMANFEALINQLFDGGVVNAREDRLIEQQYQVILRQWKQLKINHQDQTIHSVDQYVSEINKLVTLLQHGSEHKLNSLRLIQGVSLLTLIVIAFVVLFKLNRSVIVPLRQLVTVAEQAGKGDFSLKASYNADNELGVLARTINRMSKELELTYQDYEHRVDSKNKALTRSNRSLQVLYQAASRLASDHQQQNDEHIVAELEAALGIGKINIERASYESNRLKIDILQPPLNKPLVCFNRLEFPLEKSNHQYGRLIWDLPQDKEARKWQTRMLQAMADIVATDIDLQHRRSSENRLSIIEERAVIARELHDSLAQSLSYLKLQMSLLTRKMQKQLPQSDIDSTIEDIKQGLNAAYRQLRELLTTFRLKLDDPSLVNAVQGTVVEFSEKCQHKIDLDFQLVENSLSANQEIHVLHIIREALSNVHRHANASLAGVSLNLKGDKHIIEVWDNGVGMTDISQQQGHFGLGIMQERARSLQTKVYVETREPIGTRVFFEF